MDSYLSGRNQTIFCDGDDLPCIFETLKISLFPDDIQAYGSCNENNLDDFIDLVNEDLNSMSYIFNNLFVFNFKLVDKAKCLGFDVDRKLFWEDHMNNVIKKS